MKKYDYCEFCGMKVNRKKWRKHMKKVHNAVSEKEPDWMIKDSPEYVMSKLGVGRFSG
jgi:DNA-directed RNA polymerase subunit N (RpoN/RPB10)